MGNFQVGEGGEGMENFPVGGGGIFQVGCRREGETSWWVEGVRRVGLKGGNFR